MTNLPELNCMGCTKCCDGDPIPLDPRYDDIASYAYEVASGLLLLKRSSGSNNCVYLTTEGCGIHDRKPKVCRDFDCRAYYLAKSRSPTAVINDRLNHPRRYQVLMEGRRRVSTGA